MYARWTAAVLSREARWRSGQGVKVVFLIQRSQNKDTLAIHLKLNELVAALQGASNRLIEVEGLSERELRTLEEHFAAPAKRPVSRLRVSVALHPAIPDLPH